MESSEYSMCGTRRLGSPLTSIYAPWTRTGPRKLPNSFNPAILLRHHRHLFYLNHIRGLAPLFLPALAAHERLQKTL